jgi:aspartate/methionine/tyrosine aminotransferase
MILCPAGFVQKAGVVALTGSWEPVVSMAREYERRVEYVSGRLDELDGISCPKPEGAFYVWANISKISPSSVAFSNELLEKKGVVALAGVHFGSAGEGYIRLALVKSMEVLTEAVERIVSYVKNI